MANEAHLQILEQGAVAWNRWREENPGITPDLGEADLNGTRLAGLNLRRASLSWTRFSRANLARADLSGATLNGLDFSEANLCGANLDGATLAWVRFAGTNGSAASLRQARFNRVFFDKADFSRADLSGANLSEENLDGVNLSGANLGGALLKGASLRGVNLYGADLSRADLSEADLSLAGLTLVNCRETNFSAANFIGAILNGAALAGARFYRAVVGSTTFANLDLREVIGLNTVEHWRSSTIGLDTLYRSQGQIPPVFLRGIGAPDIFITTIASLTGRAIQYYSCFISYSGPDEAFARRLHADLQQNNVRCWFAPDDLKIGAKLRLSIDESIRLHDRLLLVLSEHSVASRWVEQEVETALERERRQGGTVLFPIRVDRAVMEVEGGWPAYLRNTRKIGDFSLWQEQAAYERAFLRLLRDLKAEERAGPPATAGSTGPDPLYTPTDRLASFRRRLSRHQANLDRLRERAASYGAGREPLELLNQIEAEAQEIARLEAESGGAAC